MRVCVCTHVCYISCLPGVRENSVCAGVAFMDQGIVDDQVTHFSVRD